MFSIPIYNPEAPIISQNIVKSTWGEDKTTSSWLKKEVQLRAFVDEGILTIQEKIRCPLTHPFRKAYKWVRRLFDKDFKFNQLSRLTVELSLNSSNSKAMSVFSQLDGSKQSEVLSKFNQKDLNSWEKVVIRGAISNAVAFYAEQPKEDAIQPWHTFHKVRRQVSE
jgi:hypothetical protein